MILDEILECNLQAAATVYCKSVSNGSLYTHTLLLKQCEIVTASG